MTHASAANITAKMEAGRKTDTAFLNPAFPKWSPATCRDGAPDYERRYSQVHRAAKPLDFCPHLVITSPLAAAPELIRPSAAWDTNSLVGMPADGITTSACMCGRVIQSSGPLRYAIVDGMNVRDSRVHYYPPRWNAAPSQELRRFMCSLSPQDHTPYPIIAGMPRCASQQN